MLLYHKGIVRNKGEKRSDPARDSPFDVMDLGQKKTK